MRQWVGLFNMTRFGQKVNDDLGVGRALKNVAVPFVFMAEEFCIDEVAVVGDGDRPHEVLPQQRLGVAELAGTCGGVSDMTDGRGTD